MAAASSASRPVGSAARQPQPRRTSRATSRQRIRAGCRRSRGACWNTWRRYGEEGRREGGGPSRTEAPGRRLSRGYSNGRGGPVGATNVGRVGRVGREARAAKAEEVRRVGSVERVEPKEESKYRSCWRKAGGGCAAVLWMVRDTDRTKEAAAVVPIYTRFPPLRCSASPPRSPSSPSRGELRHRPQRATPRRDARNARGGSNGGTVSQSAASRGRGGGDRRKGGRTRAPPPRLCVPVRPPRAHPPLGSFASSGASGDQPSPQPPPSVPRQCRP